MSFLCSLVFKQCFLEINWLSLRALILLFSIFIEMNPSKASRLTLDNNSSSSTLESNCMKNRRNFQYFIMKLKFRLANWNSDKIEESNDILMREIILYGLCLFIICISMFINIKYFPEECKQFFLLFKVNI